ncbi:MAG: ABC transporter ATP-binding protein [Lachnospiraceae bacterium]
MENLLEIQNLIKVFSSRRNRTTAVDQVSLSLPDASPITVAVVGESGSGKSTLANLILGFTKPTSGRIIYKGKDITHLRGKEKENYRREIQAVFQNPFDAYNPFYVIDHTFEQVFGHFQFDLTKDERRRLVEKNLEQVRLDPGQILGKYAYQMSGGQLQRIMIARALLLKPRLLIADEPVSMIDASLRVTVLDVMSRLKRQQKIAQLYITHDLSTALQISDQIIVMYKGCIVESGNAQEVIMSPAHPYTQLLISCIPVASTEEKWNEHLHIMESRSDSAQGCCFYDRCPKAAENCRFHKPEQTALSEEHYVSCFLI